jgi:hypothetical protein
MISAKPSGLVAARWVESYQKNHRIRPLCILIGW